MRSRSKKALFNSISSLIYQIVSIISGLILPRLILGAFGSNYNGITTSITQFLTFVILLKAGVGGVTKAALYKPLANNDMDCVSQIIKATEIFLKKVAIIFAIGLFLLACLYPFIVINEFDWIFSFSLVLIIGMSTFAQYYFGITYQMLLEADQNQYIISIISIISTILNILIASFLIQSGSNIQLVKFGSGLIFSINPILLSIYVKRKYKLRKDIAPNNNAIKQRWDSFAHQVAMMVRDNSDIIILTLITNTFEISVYMVYFMVIKAVNNMIRAITNGIGAALGNMLAKGEEKVIRESFQMYEVVVYSLSTIIYASTWLLITPFVQIYTIGITDVNYYRPIFGYTLAVTYLFFSIRIPYQDMVEVAGHFKQTKTGAYIEAGLNLLLTIILGWKFGITGVVLGTLVAMLFRTVQYAIYSSKNILKRNIWEFLKHIIICGINIFFIIFICNMFPIFHVTSYLSWLKYAIIIFCISIIVTLVMDLIFFGSITKSVLQKIVKMIMGKRGQGNCISQIMF